MSKSEEPPYDYLARKMWKTALLGLWHGGSHRHPGDQLYFERCRKVHLGTTLIFTRDTGHHSSGWFKNPDYERCFHLSMSSAPPLIWTPDTPDFDAKVRDAWVKAFFRDDVDKIWFEPAASRQGREAGVQHWRLFCDEHWQPLLPRGEVYSKEFTELGWRSASEMGIQIVSTLEPG